MPAISIVTINYNNLSGLTSTLQSVWTQSFRDYEHIIIDGGSTDGSKQLLEENADKFSYWISEKDGGIFNAQNKGWHQANADYVLFLNSGDSLLSSDTLQQVLPFLDGTAIIYGDLLKIEAEKEWVKKYNRPLSLHYFYWDTMPHQASFISRAQLVRQRGYDETLRMAADWKFFLDAVCKYQCSTKYLDKCIAKYDLGGLTALKENQFKLRNEREQVWLKEWEPQYATILALLQLQEDNKALRKRMAVMADSAIFRMYSKFKTLFK